MQILFPIRDVTTVGLSMLHHLSHADPSDDEHAWSLDLYLDPDAAETVSIVAEDLEDFVLFANRILDLIKQERESSLAHAIEPN